MTYEEILKIQDPIARFGLLSEFKDELEDEIRVIKPAALEQIRDEKGSDFTGRFLHTDGRTYEVRTDIDYPNIRDYDEDGTLRALELQKVALSKKSSKLTEKINVAKGDIIEAHPKMASVEVRKLAYIRKEAQNG